jgi:hypothetical protein
MAGICISIYGRELDKTDCGYRIYLGIGSGLDYCGTGGKIEYFLFKHIEFCSV